MNRKLYLISAIIFLALVAFIGGVVAVNAQSKPTSARNTLASGPTNADTAAQGSQPSNPFVAVSSTFTYQGRLLQGGSPANGNYDLAFKLYDAASGGNLVGNPVTITNQTVSDGLYTVALNTGGEFGATAFQGDARWLEIAVRPTGGGAFTPLSPRQPLTATPYAMSLMPGAVISGTSSSAILSATNTSSGFGLFGSGGVGVYGTGGNGVWGETNGEGTAVVGINNNDGTGVGGTSVSWYGVYGSSTSGTGVYGTSTSGYGGEFSSTDSPALFGHSINSHGVLGYTSSTNPGNKGVAGVNFGSGPGVRGDGTSGDGVDGISTSGDGVFGQTASGNASGVHGVNTSRPGIVAGGPAVYGENRSGNYPGPGVYGVSEGYCYHGPPGSPGHPTGQDRPNLIDSPCVGVVGEGIDTGEVPASIGVSGRGNTGVFGYGDDGVHGNSSAGIGVVGDSISGIGVFGITNSGNKAIYGLSSSTTANGDGVYGESHNNYSGVSGLSTNSGGSGVYGNNTAGGWAAYFNGNVRVTGTLTKGGGSFEIDHPLDPANKYLYHSFVESPDMMDVYNGNVTTDADGEATVVMSNWFEALNRDFRYQLTIMGDQFAQARVSSKIKDNRFIIKTDKPNIEVSWQVTGIRHDAYANAHRIPVEVDKPAKDKGYYLHPELYGQPTTKSLDNYLRDQQSAPSAGTSVPGGK